jgi:HD domain
MSSSAGATSDLAWAKRVAQQLLEPLGSRWRHTMGVAAQARRIGLILEPGEAVVLENAAYLHDVGYAPELARTGFHPLDGARFVRARGHGRLSGLVAYHSDARAQADELGLLAGLLEFEDERSLVSTALTYCDLTVGPHGDSMTPEARMAEIRERHGPDAVETRALDVCAAELVEDIRKVEAALSAR